MASPYFTPIQSSRSDFSGILQAGRAQGNMYSNLGAMIGQTVREVGSMYFEDKKLGRTFADFLRSPEGEKYAMDNMGYTPDQIAKWKDNPALIDKEVKQTFADLGGADEIRKRIQEKTELEMRMDREEQLLANSEQQAKILETQVLQSEQLQKELKATPEIFEYYFRANPDGTIAKNLDGYSKMQEHAPYINKLAQTGQIRGFSAANFSSFLLDSVKKGADITDIKGMEQLAHQYAAVSNADSATVNNYVQQARDAAIDPVDIQKTAEAKIFDTDPVMKGRMENVGTFGELMASYNNAVAYKINDDGEREAYIKNPASANMLQRAMAKIGNGGGNMTDEDVKAISGASDFQSSWNRLYNKFMPAEGDAAATALTAEDIEFIGQAGQAIFDFSNDYVQTGVRQGLENTRSAYSDRLTMPQVVKHSGFQKYLGFDSGGVDIRSGNIKAATDDDYFNGQRIPAETTAIGIQRMLEEEDMSRGEIEELFQEMNPEASMDDIRAKIDMSIQIAKQQKVSRERAKQENQKEQEKLNDPAAKKNAQDIIAGFDKFEPEYNDTFYRDAGVGAVVTATGQNAVGNRVNVSNPLSKTSGVTKKVSDKLIGEGTAKSQYLKKNPLTVKSIDAVKNADLSKLKKLAKNHGIKDLSQYTGVDGEKKLRKKVTSALKKTSLKM